MRIALAYNLRAEDTEAQAELLMEEDVERLEKALRDLGHEVIPVEMSGPADQMVDRLVASKPELVFNVAEGVEGQMREAFFPAIYRRLGLPFTGGGPGLLLVDLNKRLSEKILALRGIQVPRGAVITRQSPELPQDLDLPLIIKPNFEGSGKGIHQDSVVNSPEEAKELIARLLEKFPDGLNAEQFIPGRELTVPMLEAWPGELLEIVEHEFSGVENKIFDYEMKTAGEEGGGVKVVCPPKLKTGERQAVLDLARRAFQAMPCPDFGRVDIRLHEDGTPYYIETNPLPALQPSASLMVAARSRGLDFTGTIERVVRSAAQRYGLCLGARAISAGRPGPQDARPTCREAGIPVGRLPTGRWNAITDLEGIHVGHVTHRRDDVPIPGQEGKLATVRTGITAVVPVFEDLFNNHLAAGGFVLNGIGEMSGLTQVMEWGWLETPVLLTNTMSVGPVQTGIIRHMIEKHPELGEKVDVVIPVVGETNDAFLNEVRLLSNAPEDALRAIEVAHGGGVEQGSVGGGTGMVSFDFAGGIGSSSRVLPRGMGGYTLGVLVQSNFGKLRNLTVDGAVVGRELDPLYPMETRRGKTYGSVLVVVATDAPLLSSQLNRLAKRAALGIGRVGSYGATTSGEIVFAFSTGNRSFREARESAPLLQAPFVNDIIVNLLYEAAVEATEEAILNAMFCSPGMSGKDRRYAPPVPAEAVLEIVSRRRKRDGGLF